jgi:hypothetical protein
MERRASCIALDILFTSYVITTTRRGHPHGGSIRRGMLIAIERTRALNHNTKIKPRAARARG